MIRAGLTGYVLCEPVQCSCKLGLQATEHRRLLGCDLPIIFGKQRPVVLCEQPSVKDFSRQVVEAGQLSIEPGIQGCVLESW